MSTSDKIREVLDEARVFPHDGNPHVYVIGHDAVGVSVYSQQVRALNLIWAYASSRAASTAPEAQLAGQHLVVIGGGIAGVTAATAACVLGARVTVLEKANQLLALQTGCHHRFLHPRIYDWPRPKSLMAAAHLPLLDWSVGTADSVVRRMIDQFKTLCDDAAVVHLGVRHIEVTPPHNRVRFRLNTGRDDELECHAVIFAVGFGVENTIDLLPRRSYWRVDPLDQSPVGHNDQYRVLIGGEGDGGIIDVLRTTLEDFDHGPFVDRFLDLMWEPTFRDAVAKIESAAGARLDLRLRGVSRAANAEECAILIHDGYRKLCDDFPEITTRVRTYLKELRRPGIQVTWAGQLAAPSSPRGMPFNRLLSWFAVRDGLVTYSRASVRHVEVVPQNNNTEGERYEAWLLPIDASSPPYLYGDIRKERFHDVVLRYGSTPALQTSFPEIWQTMEGRSAKRAVLVDEAFDAFRSATEARGRARADSSDHVRLRAALSPAAAINHTQIDQEKWPVFRIRLSVHQCRPTVNRVTYLLHPEYQGVKRRAEPGPDRDFSTWIYTYDDYWVEAVCSDGTEVAGGWLTHLLRASSAESSTAAACTALSTAASALRGADYSPAARQKPRPFERMAGADIERKLRRSAAQSSV